MTGKALRIHLANTGSGRPRNDGRVRSLCGKPLAPALIGEPTCASCIAFAKAATAVDDLAVLEADRTLKREYMARYRAENPEKTRASREAYEAKNRAALNAKAADYRKFFREECAERCKQWHRNNPGYDANYNRTRRPKLKSPKPPP